VLLFKGAARRAEDFCIFFVDFCLAVTFYFLSLRRVTFVRSYKSNQKSSYLACQFQQAMFCIPYKSIEYEAHSHRLVRLLMNNNFWIDLNSLQVKLHEIKVFVVEIFSALYEPLFL